LSQSPSFEELGKLEDFQARRPSQASAGMLSTGSSPSTTGRKNSLASIYNAPNRKMSQISRTNTEYSMAPATRKDSNLSQARLTNTFAGSLHYLYLADNRLEDEVFREIVMLPELRVLNLSYNELDDFPQGVLRRWPNLTELYLSGNELTSLPSDDLEESSNLKVLHLNANRFQVLPAELCNVHKLATLDVGSNSLKYNVSNWPYDWNWNRNLNLKYLNFSANKRLEIKPAAHQNQTQFNSMTDGQNTDLTSFNNLKYLRVLGLMDVTLLINTIPDDTEDRRVRTSASLAGALMYGMADSLGKNDHLSTLDLLKLPYRGHEAEILVAMFDGQTMTSGGSRIAKYLHENFAGKFAEELTKVEAAKESPVDAMRRTFLTLNKEMANFASSNFDAREHRLANGHRGSVVANILGPDDLNSGGVATVLYLNGTELHVANVGDVGAILISSNGQHKDLTTKHDPANMKERERIREAGGYVSRQGKLNDSLEVSRAFGYYNHMPSVIAAPSTKTIQLGESDELIVVASREFWEYITVDLAIDAARADKNDLMLAAQKLRDLALAFGARDKIMVMVLGIADLRKRGHSRFRGTSLSMAKELGGDDTAAIFPSSRKSRRKGETLVGDSRLARLDEPEAPTGEVAICFTDIKNSTALWEILPVPMRSAIMMHNELMRRQLRIIGGYEVKTEGDAFMVAFPTVTSALLWCFSCQSHLLELQWPTEILDTSHCQEKFDADQNTIYRGLSVRMGIHWGRPVCEQDPITRRMDYFGPMVNKSARVSAVADGGQITVSSDFIAEVQRTLESYADEERRDSVGSQDTVNDDPLANQVRRELRQLSSQGFEVKDLGERKLKGLENPEFIYLMYPHSLVGRLNVPPGAEPKPTAGGEATEKGQPGALSKDTQLSDLQVDEVWQLWDLALRLEMLCSCLENPEKALGLHKPEMSLLTRMKNQGGVVSDNFMMNLLDHQVTRVEVSRLCF
jgi:adenylate cyclase